MKMMLVEHLREKKISQHTPLREQLHGTNFQRPQEPQSVAENKKTRAHRAWQTRRSPVYGITGADIDGIEGETAGGMWLTFLLTTTIHVTEMMLNKAYLPRAPTELVTNSLNSAVATPQHGHRSRSCGFPPKRMLSLPDEPRTTSQVQGTSAPNRALKVPRAEDFPPTQPTPRPDGV